MDVFEEADESPASEEEIEETEEPFATTEDLLPEAGLEEITEVSENTETAEVTSEEVIQEEPAEATSEEVIQEEPVETEETDEENFAEVDNLDNAISESNLDYLTTKEKDSSVEDSSANVSTDLKQDIKSVLLYMDQLLENLPEEKIIEFAKSDEFVTYKKLFNELGLS